MEEFELTYLAKREIMDKLEGCSFKEMLDIYIPESSDHPTLRIRKNGDRFEMTKKQPIKENDSSHQLETTIPLTKGEFLDFSQLRGKRVSKNRFFYKESDHTYEIDVFQGELKGLVLVDIEFKSANEKDVFVPPSWVLAEVTQEKFIAGGMLCGKGYADIEDKLKTFGYSKI